MANDGATTRAPLDGRVAIVTGAARGSGEATARHLAAAGARVVVTDVRDDLGRAVAESMGDAAVYLRCDVTDETDWTRTVEGTIDRFGRVDVLVNNAAVLLLASVADTTREEYERVWRVNELGTFLGIRAVIEPMRAVGGGSIVNISSIDGVYVAPMTSAYAASKFAVRGLAKVAALELGSAGIRVNCVCPAAGNPDMVRDALPEPLRAVAGADGHGGAAPPAVGRHGTVDDVAAAVVFLASDASGYMTGTEIVLDGGESAGWNLMSRMERSRPS